ncbi:MAG: glycosyltransferase family 4 protein [Victivallaceae bacterium]|nr:glycosyltransferase family 4 protein [Victivallaceae bacterium]
MRVCFLFPGAGDNICGGLKVVAEYANRFAADGFDVHIAYAGSIFWREKTLFYKLTNVVRYFQHRLRGFSCRKWFPLDERVKEHYAFSLCYRHVPRADRYIATSPYTAMYLNDYPVDADKKFYFIQGYENWGAVTDGKLHATYRYKMHKIAVSGWLARIIRADGESCAVIPNGFDFQKFGMDIPVAEKKRFRVMMLYHEMEKKGCRYGFAALEEVHKKFPQLEVVLFGVYPPPENLPEYIRYFRSPAPETLRRLYNGSAVYLGCSVAEGWGLTVGEAMLCGCAVVCTDNPGYLEMAVPEENALVSPIRDAAGLAQNVIRLFEDDALRQRIALAGNRAIQKFSWDESDRFFQHLLRGEER